MPRVRLAAVPLLAGLLPLTAGALGLGEMTLRSGLNQPFVAEIPVTADSLDELNQLSVQLAPAADFERVGLDRPRFLEGLSFQVQREGSRALVRVTSTQPVSEPFVSLLVDVGWPQGRLLREYTVLLDPPAFARPDGAGQDASRQAVAAPAAPGPAASVPAIRRPQPPDGGLAPGNTAKGSLTSGPGGDTYGPVRSNETLWGISKQLRANSNDSLNQLMVALYRANPETFAGNINRLRRGAILRVPGGSDLSGVSSREATTEVQRQDEAWRSGTGVAPVTARLQLVPPAEKASGTGAAKAAAPGAGTSSSPTAGADGQRLEQKLAEQQRLLSIKDGQLKALQDRVSQLEGRTPAPTPAAEAPAAAPPAEVPVPAPGSAVAPVATNEPPTATQRAAEGRKPAKSPALRRGSGGGFLSGLAGVIFNVWFLVAAAAVLVLGLFYVFPRRRMATADEADSRFDNELGSDMPPPPASTPPVASLRGYSVEEGADDRTQAMPALGRAAARGADTETPLERTISTEGSVELDQADVVAEADFHMAYGLYDQAAELLTRALRDSPDRRDLRLKLLEVFFIWENKAGFLKEAKIFQGQLKGVADPSWNKVVIMGKQICPGEPLFAGAVSGIGDVGLDLALANDDKGGVDISFEEIDAASLDLPPVRKRQISDLLDFDPGSMDEESVDDTSEMQAASAPRRGGESGAGTREVPTVEARYDGDYSPTMETPTIQSRELGASTMETPTLESAVQGLRTGADQTEEINLEDLGLDLAGLDEAAGELGTGVHGALDGGEEVYDLGTADDDASGLLQELAGDSTAEMRGMAIDEGTPDSPAFGNAMERSAADRDSPVDTTSDTAEHRVVEDTAEQPRLAGTGLGDASAELSQVDFDIGDGKGEDFEPTSVMIGRRRGPEGPTMTEVGTKLDLARAYVDMGDPDGARSILNEVLEEGDSAQRQEARRLLDDLSD